MCLDLPGIPGKFSASGPTVSAWCDTFRCGWTLHRDSLSLLGDLAHPTEHLFGLDMKVSNICSYVKLFTWQREEGEPMARNLSAPVRSFDVAGERQALSR